MEFYLTYLKDTIGNNYVGLKFSPDFISKYLQELRDHISDEEYEEYIQNQKNRDGDGYHITVINVMEYNTLFSKNKNSFLESIEKNMKIPIKDLNLKGIGSASRNENKTFFVVCDSNTLSNIRSLYSLPEHDFHITLGFKYKDVFGVRKNEVLPTNSKFKKEIGKKFFEREDFEFVKKIENFQLSPNKEVIPISFDDKYLKVFCDGVVMDITLLEDPERLYIVSKYDPENKIVRMSKTEFIKKLND